MNLWTWRTGHWESQSGLLFGWTSKHPWHHLTHFEAESQTCILPISFCSRLLESPLDGFYICSSSGFVRKQGVHIYIYMYICVCFVHPNNALVDHHLPNFQWPSFGVYPIFIHLISIYIYLYHISYISHMPFQTKPSVAWGITPQHLNLFRLSRDMPSEKNASISCGGMQAMRFGRK